MTKHQAMTREFDQLTRAQPTNVDIVFFLVAASDDDESTTTAGTATRTAGVRIHSVAWWQHPITMKNLAANYGSVEEPEDVTDRSFDPDNAYYVKETSLPLQQRLKKMLICSMPILAAILIVGGAALYLLRDFNSLYPGAGGHGDKTPQYSGATTTTRHSSLPQDYQSAETTQSPEANSKSPHVNSGSADCSAHPDCSGLVGVCCPTGDGVFLGCCS